MDQLAYEGATDDKALPARPSTDSNPSSTAPSLQAVENSTYDVPVTGTATATQAAYNGDNELFNKAPLSPRHGESTRLLNIDPAASSAQSHASERILQPWEAGDGGDNSPHLPTGHPGPSPIAIPTSHLRDASEDGPDHGFIPVSGSWLDSKADSGGSASSSVHSRTSSHAIRRKPVARPPSGDTEAQFDAALDAAVEAAYDEGFEPQDSDEDHASMVANAMMRVELAKERVRQSERETLEMNQGRALQQNTYQPEQPALREGFFDDESSDEEERLLEEMTRGYEIEDFAFSQRSSFVDQDSGEPAPDSDMEDNEGLSNPRHPDNTRNVASRI